MVKNVSIRNLRANLAEALEDVNNHFTRYIISRRNKPEAVLMNLEDYEGWIETLEIMSDSKAMDDIRTAREEIEAGKFHKFEDVFGKKKTK